MHDTHHDHHHHDDHHDHDHHDHHDHGHEHEHHDHDHHEGHSHEHDPAPITGELQGTTRLRKIVEHWIGHNEDHADSYRLWASRAREAGQESAAALLEEIASETVKQNEKFLQIIQTIDSSQ